MRAIDGLDPGRTRELVVTAAIHGAGPEVTALVQIGGVAAEINPTNSAALGFERFVVVKAPAAMTELRLSGLISDYWWAGVLIDAIEIPPVDSNPPTAPGPVLVDGFEDGPQAPIDGWVEHGAGDRFGAWLVTNGTVSRDHAAHHGQSAADGHYLDLDDDGVVERVVDGLEPGRRYLLTLGASRHRYAQAASAQVIIGDLSVVVAPTMASTDGFDRIEIEFVASAWQTVLRLAAVEGSATMGVVIDEV